jgi:putative FmdB family regulatory protein
MVPYRSGRHTRQPLVLAGTASFKVRAITGQQMLPFRLRHSQFESTTQEATSPADAIRQQPALQWLGKCIPIFDTWPPVRIIENRGASARSSIKKRGDGKMPIYVYRCEKCGLQFEKFQHFNDEPVKVCPECGGPVHRVYQPVGIIFKGSGFYVTDNRSNNSAGLPPKAEKETESAPAESSKKEDSKSESSSST